jgi:hypothetical protein
MQIVQESPERVVLRVVKDSTADARTDERLLEEMRRALGAGLRFEIEPRSTLQQDANGKYRFAVCNIAGGREGEFRG